MNPGHDSLAKLNNLKYIYKSIIHYLDIDIKIEHDHISENIDLAAIANKGTESALLKFL